MKSSSFIWVCAYLAVFGVLFGCVVSGSIPSEPKEHIDLKEWHNTFKQPHQTHIHEFIIGLKLRNTEVLPSLLYSVSDPKLPTYGRYYSKAEVESLTAPTVLDVNNVKDWIMMYSPQSVEVLCGGGFLSVKMSVENIEKLFGINTVGHKLTYWKHSSSSQTILRTSSALNFPNGLEIDIVSDINDFPYIKQKKSNWGFEEIERKVEASSSSSSNETISIFVFAGNSAISVFISSIDASITDYQITLNQSNYVRQFTQPRINSTQLFSITGLANYEPISQLTVCGVSSGSTGECVTYGSTKYPSDWITPDLVKRIYNIPLNISSFLNDNNSQSVAEFDGQYYSPSDLQQFWDLMSTPPSDVVLVGDNDPSSPGVESTLDIQWITAIGAGVKTYFWSVNKGFLLNWVIQISNSTNPPLVNSISYGSPEALSRPSHITRLNNEFSMLGMRGISIISTAGDLGSSDGTKDCNHDVPDFPSSSPFTTSLGATYLFTSNFSQVCNHHSVFGVPIKCAAYAEYPCSSSAGSGFTTGGGFSGFFARPEYQNSAVTKYLQSASLPPSSYFNSSCRGYNDVAAFGYNILTYQSGLLTISGGTSASGPIFAGMVGLLNGYRLNSGKASLGFLNPWLYQLAEEYEGAFFQVLKGDNRCREVGANGVLENCCEYGFDAQSGWNPLSGLGTPNFSALKSSLDYLP